VVVEGALRNARGIRGQRKNKDLEELDGHSVICRHQSTRS
jgi:hypothetical protein